MPDVISIPTILRSNPLENHCLYEIVRWNVMIKYSGEELFMNFIGICSLRLHNMWQY